MMPSADCRVCNATGAPEADGILVNDERGIREENKSNINEERKILNFNYGPSHTSEGEVMSIRTFV